VETATIASRKSTLTSTHSPRQEGSVEASLRWRMRAMFREGELSEGLDPRDVDLEPAVGSRRLIVWIAGLR